MSDLRRVVLGAGFTSFFDILSGVGSIDHAAKIKFFFVHFKVTDKDMLSIMHKIRASGDDNLRFSPFVLIIDDCDYEDIVKYVRLGLDDVISLPEKPDILRHRLEAQLRAEQVYFETPEYFGPDRRRMDLVPLRDNRRNPEGGRHMRYRIRRDPAAGLQVIQMALIAA